MIFAQQWLLRNLIFLGCCCWPNGIWESRCYFRFCADILIKSSKQLTSYYLPTDRVGIPPLELLKETNRCRKAIKTLRNWIPDSAISRDNNFLGGTSNFSWNFGGHFTHHQLFALHVNHRFFGGLLGRLGAAPFQVLKIIAWQLINWTKGVGGGICLTINDENLPRF